MKRRDLEKALLFLETTPFVYENIVLSADPTLRKRIAESLWEAVAIEEHVWGARIRLFRGDDPALLPRLDRDAARRIAAGQTGARNAVAEFLRLRRENARVLRLLTSADERRKREIEGGGGFSLADLPGAMAENDQCVLGEIARRIVGSPGRASKETSPELASV